MNSILILSILAALFVISRVFNIFDLKGTTAAFAVGLVVAFLGSLYWLLVLLIFALSSHFATKSFFQEKKNKNLQEGSSGERRVSNIFYAAVIGMIISSLNFTNAFTHIFHFHYFELFAISLAVVNSDTFASEIGVIDKKVYLITNLKPTTPGINGGISLTGEAAALFGAFIVAISYVFLSSTGFNVIQLVFITLMGFAGCQIDSLLGALWENVGKLTKGEVNFLASFFSVLTATIIFLGTGYY